MILAAGFLVAYLARAENYPEAMQSAAWNKIEGSARGAAMGGALSAVPGDPFALDFNPAGLALGEGFMAGVSHTAFVLGIRSEEAAASRDAAVGRVGIAIRYVDLGQEIQRTQSGIEGPPFGAYGYAATLGYARGDFWAGRVAFGAAARFLSETLFYETNRTFAVDAGAVATFAESVPSGEGTTPPDSLRAGLSVQDAGVGIGDAWLASRMRIGISATLHPHGGSPDSIVRSDRVLASIESVLPANGSPSLAGGLEYGFRSFAYARIGYRRSLSARGAAAGAGGPTAGLGFRFHAVGLDYAYAAEGTFAGTHRVAVTFGFDSGVDGRDRTR